MYTIRKLAALTLGFFAATASVRADDEVLRGTSPLPLEPGPGLPARIASQWDAYLLGQIENAKSQRSEFWQRDHSSAEAYARSLAPNRERLRRIVGAIDERVAFAAPELVAHVGEPAVRAETAGYTARAVRWPVLPDVHGEGLLLMPKGGIRGCVVAVPDAGQTPETLAGINPGLTPPSQFPRRLAENGFVVLIPTLLFMRTQGDLTKTLLAICCRSFLSSP
jgi:hypothetical protein